MSPKLNTILIDEMQNKSIFELREDYAKFLAKWQASVQPTLQSSSYSKIGGEIGPKNRAEDEFNSPKNNNFKSNIQRGIKLLVDNSDDSFEEKDFQMILLSSIPSPAKELLFAAIRLRNEMDHLIKQENINYNFMLRDREKLEDEVERQKAEEMIEEIIKHLKLAAIADDEEAEKKAKLDKAIELLLQKREELTKQLEEIQNRINFNNRLLAAHAVEIVRNTVQIFNNQRQQIAIFMQEVLYPNNPPQDALAAHSSLENLYEEKKGKGELHVAFKHLSLLEALKKVFRLVNHPEESTNEFNLSHAKAFAKKMGMPNLLKPNKAASQKIDTLEDKNKELEARIQFLKNEDVKILKELETDVQQVVVIKAKIAAIDVKVTELKAQSLSQGSESKVLGDSQDASISNTANSEDQPGSSIYESKQSERTDVASSRQAVDKTSDLNLQASEENKDNKSTSVREDVEQPGSIVTEPTQVEQSSIILPPPHLTGNGPPSRIDEVIGKKAAEKEEDQEQSAENPVVAKHAPENEQPKKENNDEVKTTSEDDLDSGVGDSPQFR